MEPIYNPLVSQDEKAFEQRQLVLAKEIEFEFDVFVSQAYQDRDSARGIALLLQKEGLRVWFDEWVGQPGDDISVKIEHGLEHSRVLLFCMSANAFGSEWALLEARTLRFRDPLNRKRRFVSLRLDHAEIPSQLAQTEYVDWAREEREIACAKLLQACRSGAPSNEASAANENILKKAAHLNYKYDEVRHYAFSPMESASL